MKIQFTIAAALLIFLVKAQNTIYYDVLPTDSSLKILANDLALQFNKATGTTFSVQKRETTTPASGVWLHMDPSIGIIGNQTAIVNSTEDFLTITAPFAHGVRYGAYQYLEEKGFRFYGPDENYEKIPSLTSPFTVGFNRTYQPTMSYHSWFGSGGIGLYPIDQNQLTVEKYDAWVTFQQRNNMENEYAVGGHNTGTSYSNPCYVAEYEGSNQNEPSSVPNVYYNGAMQEWSDYILGLYNTYFNLHSDDRYASDIWGIEPEDGAQFGNSYVNTSCEPAASGQTWMSPSDQQFTLANFTTNYLMAQTQHPRKTLCFAYGNSADLPTVDIHPDIVVMLAQGFQIKKSPLAYANMWSKKHASVFEYHYLNLPDQTGQTPFVNWDDMKATAKRLKNAGSLGIFYESTYSKFSTIPFLYALNRYIKDDTDPDFALNEYLTDLWGNAAPKMKELYKLWGTADINTPWIWLFDNVYRLPVYYKLVNEAASLAQSPQEQQRFCELKAYMVYLSMYFDAFQGLDDANSIQKMEKIDKLITYLASINELNIINVYRQIELALNKIPQQHHATYLHKWAQIDNFSYIYDLGTAWSSIQQLTCNEIDTKFQNLLVDPLYNPVQDPFVLVANHEALIHACETGLKSRDTIDFHYYTPGGAVLFNINSPEGQSVKILFENDTTNSYIYFNLDALDQSYTYDTALLLTGNGGEITLTFPYSGEFRLSMASDAVTHADIDIITNGNYFFKSSPGNPLYYEDHLNSMDSYPEYIYVPEGTSKIYTVFSNLCFSCLDSTQIQENYFVIQPDGLQAGNHPTSDTLLFYYDVPAGMDGKFWKMVSTNGSLSMTTVNIVNSAFYLEQGSCEQSPFTEVVENKVDQVSLFPNPTNGNITLSYDSKWIGSNFSIFDYTGRKILERNLKSEHQENFNLSSYQKGVYIGLIRSNDGTQKTLRFIVN